MDSLVLVVSSWISPNVQSVLQRQLYINEAVSGQEWDARLVADPNYTTQLKIAGHRILIVRPLTDTFNRDAVDYVTYVNQGLIVVEYTKYGPPGSTWPVDRIQASDLKWANKIPPGVAQNPLKPVWSPRDNTAHKETDPSPFVSNSIINQLKPVTTDPNLVGQDNPELQDPNAQLGRG